MKRHGRKLASRRRQVSDAERELMATFYRRVWELDKGRCRVLNVRRSMFSPFLERHHVIPKERLRRDGHPIEVVWDPDNGMLVDVGVHARHTDAFVRIPREAVPQRAEDFAARYGYLHLLNDGVIYPRRQTTNPKGVQHGEGN